MAGGCDNCDAYQTLAEIEPKVWKLTVHHDDDCHVLARHRRSA